MSRFKFSKHHKFTSVAEYEVYNAVQKISGRRIDRTHQGDINSFFGYCYSLGIFNLPFESNMMFIPYRLPVIAEGYRNDTINTKNSLLLDYVNSYPDTIFVVADMVGDYKDAFFMLRVNRPDKSDLRNWVISSTSNDISLAIRSHGELNLLISNMRSFITKQTSEV
jgi:hypothetical protein